MKTEKVVIIHLRRPKGKGKNPKEMRTDPFWEFCSFGLTGCHHNNLLSKNNAENLAGMRLAFIQGGKSGTRLVFLTPQVSVERHGDSRFEVKWKQNIGKSRMPFRYDCAPIVVQNSKEGDYKTNFEKFAYDALGDKRNWGRTTAEGQFSSKFRSRTRPIDGSFAKEIIGNYNLLRRKAGKARIASSYLDALPFPPPKEDNNRKHTYDQYLAKAKHSSLGCKPLNEPSTKPGRCTC